MSNKLTAALFVALLSTPFLHAEIVTYSSQSQFDAQGTIAYSTSFTCGTGFCFEPNPWTIGGVTYTTGDNLVVGLDSGYGNAVGVFVYGGWTPMTGTIQTSPTEDMFGFDLASLGGTSPMDITLSTNLGTYSYSDVTVPNVDTGMQFFGYIATPGEYLTGFNIASVDGVGYAPAITDVELGNAGSVVPEPGTFLMMGSGLLGLAGVLRRKLAR